MVNLGVDNHFGGVVWTNHALDRLRERGIKQGDAWATWRNPRQSKRGNAPGSWVYYRSYGNVQIEVVAKQNERKEWIILSVWSRPVFQNNGLEYSKKYTFWDAIGKLLGLKK